MSLEQLRDLWAAGPPGRWENWTIPEYLGATAAWLKNYEQAFVHSGLPAPADGWPAFAQAVCAAAIYGKQLATHVAVPKLPCRPATRSQPGAWHAALRLTERTGFVMRGVAADQWTGSRDNAIIGQLDVTAAEITELGGLIQRMPDQLGEVELAVFVLGSGEMVSLSRAEGSPVGGYTLICASPDGARVLDQFLREAGLGRDRLTISLLD